jgi:hypothetical protein
MLINSTIQDVSQKVNIGYDGVVGVMERRMAEQVDWSRFERLEVMGIDEIALQKGQRDCIRSGGKKCYVLRVAKSGRREGAGDRERKAISA